VTEDTLGTIEMYETKATSIGGFPSVSNLAVLGQNAMICRSEQRDQSDFYFPANSDYPSQSEPDVCGPRHPATIEERPRQETQVASRQTKVLSTWVRTRRFDVQNRRLQWDFILLAGLQSIPFFRGRRPWGFVVTRGEEHPVGHPIGKETVRKGQARAHKGWVSRPVLPNLRRDWGSERGMNFGPFPGNHGRGFTIPGAFLIFFRGEIPKLVCHFLQSQRGL